MRPIDICIAVGIAFIWGFNFVVIKIGIDAFPPLFFSALRFLLAAIPLVFLLPRPNVSWKIIVGIGLVLGVIKFGLLFIGMDLGVSAGLASLILQCQAFFTVILAALIFSDRPNMRQIFGMSVAFIGLGLVTLTVDANFTYIGFFLVVLAGLAWAVSNLIMKQANATNMLSLMVWVSLVPPIPLFLLSILFEGWENDLNALHSLDWKGIGAVFYIAYVATILGFAAWGRLIRTYGVTKIAPFSLLVPIFGMASSALFLGEAFGPVRLAAAGLVMIGLVLTAIKPSTDK